MATTETLTARLSEAEEALHQAMLGGAVRVIVDQTGERIEYAPGNVGRLQSYINELKRQLGQLTVTGPARVFL